MATKNPTKSTGYTATGKKIGRPTKLCPEVVNRILTAVLGGSYLEVAASHAGVRKDTFYNWLRDGARDSLSGKKTALAAFSDSLQKAMADSELRDLKTIEDFANGHPIEVTKTVIVKDGAGGIISETTTVERRVVREWTAAAWRLERKHWKRWGRTYNRTEITGPGGKALPAPILYLPEKVLVPGALMGGNGGNGGNGGGNGKKPSIPSRAIIRR